MVVIKFCSNAAQLVQVNCGPKVPAVQPHRSPSTHMEAARCLLLMAAPAITRQSDFTISKAGTFRTARSQAGKLVDVWWGRRPAPPILFARPQLWGLTRTARGYAKNHS